MDVRGRTIFKTSSHIYISPHRLLSPYVAHYTVMPPDHEFGFTSTVIPDASGCIVFKISQNEIERSTLWGPTTKAQAVTSQSQKNNKSPVWLVFIEFRPCGLFGLTGISVNGIKDNIVSLSDILPNRVAAFQKAFQLSTSWEELFDCFDNILLSDCQENGAWKLSNGILQQLHQSNGTITAKALSEEFAYSERHLNRLLSGSLGMSVKSYVKLLRVNLAVTALRDESIPLTTLSQQLGYYDQAHFNHNFNEIIGMSPSDYRNQMSDFYNELYKF